MQQKLTDTLISEGNCFFPIRSAQIPLLQLFLIPHGLDFWPKFLLYLCSLLLLCCLLWTELCLLQNLYVEALTISTSECDCIWDKTFKEVTELEMGSQDGPSSTLTGILIRRWNLDTQIDIRDMCAQRKDHVRIQQESGHLQAKEKES